MRTVSVIVGMVSTIFLVGAAVALHFLTPPVFEESFRKALGSVRSMHQLGAEWSVETARVQADPSANFDGLTEFVPRMKRLRDDLAESIAYIPNLPERLTADIRAYSATMDSLRERVERFKTAYAVIRNSERYFPLASANVILRAEQVGNQQFAREIADLTVEMDSYLASPSETAKELLNERLQTVTEAGAREPEEVSFSVENFTAHAKVLLDKRVRSKELFEGIAGNSLSKRTNPLTEFLETVRNDRRRTTSLYQQSAVGCGAGALFIGIFVGFTKRSAATRQLPPRRIVRHDEYADKHKMASSTEHIPIDSQTTGALRFVSSLEVPTGEMPVGVTGGSGVGTHRGGTGTDTMDSLLATGALAGLMGQSMGTYTRRMQGDLNALSGSDTGGQVKLEVEETGQLWGRVRGDLRRLDFVARRLLMLGKRLAPTDRMSIDVNQCLGEVLEGTGAENFCVVERKFGEIPEIHGSITEIRLMFTMCVEYILRGLGELRNSEAELLVWTKRGKGNVVVAFIYNGDWIAPEHQVGQFIPFYGSIEAKAGLALPAARYLARRHGGTTVLDMLSDNRAALSVQLPVDARKE